SEIPRCFSAGRMAIPAFFKVFSVPFPATPWTERLNLPRTQISRGRKTWNLSDSIEIKRKQCR
ncbi:MAG: hypothetical protein QNI99_22030, partial [Woeseiaceae bacterium]|nr:hypothetical protein [Woeseiaceae bacterium]